VKKFKVGDVVRFKKWAGHFDFADIATARGKVVSVESDHVRILISDPCLNPATQFIFFNGELGSVIKVKKAKKEA
jgi:hypothetical protein